MKIQVIDRGEFAPEIRNMNPARLVPMDLSSEVQATFENVMTHYVFQPNTAIMRQQIAMEMRQQLGRGAVTDITTPALIDGNSIQFEIEIDGVKYTVGVGPTVVT